MFSMKTIQFPTPEEYAPYYNGYVQFAIKRGDVVAAMPLQLKEMDAALGALTDSQARFKPAPEEWSIKEVVTHLIDTERVFAYRMFCISRKDKTPFPGFEQDDYVREANADEIALSDLLEEFALLRRANILAIQNTKEANFAEMGTASGNPVSARALVYMLVGHVEHHMASLHEKYLPAV